MLKKSLPPLIVGEVVQILCAGAIFIEHVIIGMVRINDMPFHSIPRQDGCSLRFLFPFVFSFRLFFYYTTLPPKNEKICAYRFVTRTKIP